MSVFLMASLGGFVSFASTALGAFLGKVQLDSKSNNRWNLSIDFALGLMVSASAFSLIGPAAIDAGANGRSINEIMLASVLGIAFVLLLKSSIQYLQDESSLNVSHLLLVSVLMLHNFPEGLASGSAVAGLSFFQALPIVGGIAIQNIPEGALMLICLKAMGWSNRNALLGGLGSGVVELVGGMTAGIILQQVEHILPLLLSFAGGSMLASVAVEILENKKMFWTRLSSLQFTAGLIVLPFLQFILLSNLL